MILFQTLPAEKKKMDDMLAQRRRLLGILRQLYERCGEVDEFTNELGLKSPAECPKEIDEKKQLAAEFERGLSWLIGRIAAVITELNLAKRRLSDSEGKVNRAERKAKDIAEQLSKAELTVRNLTGQLEELEAQLQEVT